MSVLLSSILLLSVTATSQLNQYNAAEADESKAEISVDQNARLSSMQSEPLIPSDRPIVRSFEYPTIRFNGKVASTVVETIIWYPSGTMTVSDTRGYQISMSIPASQGDVELLQNSTMVAQKVTGSELQYTVYWKPVKNSEGYIDKYKFIIEGTSVGDSTISFNLKTSQYIYAQENIFLATESFVGASKSSPEIDSEDTSSQMSGGVNGLGFDWSDAVSAGYQVQYDKPNFSINISVDKSFSVDPYVVATNVSLVSPDRSDFFEGEQRVISVSNGTNDRLYVFYYDSSNIVYKTSDDKGATWSATPTSLGTGVLVEFGRKTWSLTTTAYANTTYVNVFYFTTNGINTDFWAKRGNVTVTDIIWDSSTFLFSAENFDIVPPTVYPAVSAVPDINGNVYAVFTWLPAGAGTIQYKVLKSSNGGLSWTTSLGTVSTSESEMAMILAPLNSTGMLLVYSTWSSGNLFYRVFDGSAWGTEQTLTGTGMVGSKTKQLSAVGDGWMPVYVAYTNVTASVGGILKVATFSNDGTFQGFETADSTLRHYLPNIMYNFNGDLNINSIAYISGQGCCEIYNTRNANGVWESPFNPYGTSPVNPAQLTATNLFDTAENSALWLDNSTLVLGVGLLEQGTISEATGQQVSPKLGDWYEGQRRVVINSNDTMFSFYYDGSNIVYTKSYDLGDTWTGKPISTGTGSVAPDNFRWSLAYSGDKGSYPDRIALLYYQISGSNTKFYQKTFIANDNGLVLVSTVNTFSPSTASACNPPPTNLCAAAAGASDDNGNLWAAYRWKSGTDWKYRILVSTDGGSTWSTSLAATTIAGKFAFTMTSLSGTKMLFVYARNGQSTLEYRVFDGSTWGGVNTISAGIATGVPKQLSSETVNGTKKAYIAFLSGGYQGTLKVARFAGSGVFEAVETLDSTLTHQLPPISVTFDDEIRINTVYNDVVYETLWNTTAWQAPTTPFGTYFETVDQLTSPTIGLTNTGVTWTEGTGYLVQFGGLFDNLEPQLISAPGKAYVAAYHALDPHFGVQKVQVTCNFGGTDRTKIPKDNYLVCSQSNQVPTDTSREDWGVQAFLALFKKGKMRVGFAVYKACEKFVPLGLGPCHGLEAGTSQKIAGTAKPISAAINDDVTLYMEWKGDQIKWYYKVGVNKPKSFAKWTKHSQVLSGFNTGIYYDGVLGFTALYSQTGVSSKNPIAQTGWQVEIKRPSYAKTNEQYVAYYTPAKSVEGNLALIDAQFLWGGSPYTGVHADYNCEGTGFGPGRVKFFYNGTSLGSGVDLWGVPGVC